MRRMDRQAAGEYGISENLLMENAGLAACSAIGREMEVPGKRFLLFCGSGNNGGDGLVVARKLHSMKAEAAIRLLGDAGKFKGSSLSNFTTTQKLGLDIQTVADTADIEAEIAGCDAIVDGIFGTGLDRKIEGIYSQVIELINESGKKVFSLDIPSGIHGDTGQEMGISINADCTVTFGLPKTGNLLYPGYERGGRLYVSHISFPPDLYEDEKLLIEINRPKELPPRIPEGHKGTFGDALIVAGASGYFGAPYFAAMSFLKAGGGYSRLAAPADIVPHLACGGSEIVFVPQSATESGSLSLSNRDGLLDLAGSVNIVVLGPGLSLDEETQELVRELAGNIEKPLVIDGDGLTALSGSPDILSGRKFPTVLTPHTGEMSVLSGLSKEEINGDRIGTVRKWAGRLQSVVVLKGAHSLIGFPDGRIRINTTGNSGMATAGSGDVLTGTIAAAFGLGLPIEEAVCAGVLIHGTAGDLAAEQIGEDGVTARDIQENLPRAVRMYRDDYSGLLKRCDPVHSVM